MQGRFHTARWCPARISRRCGQMVRQARRPRSWCPPQLPAHEPMQATSMLLLLLQPPSHNKATHTRTGAFSSEGPCMPRLISCIHTTAAGDTPLGQIRTGSLDLCSWCPGWWCRQQLAGAAHVCSQRRLLQMLEWPPTQVRWATALCAFAFVRRLRRAAQPGLPPGLGGGRLV
eukprot:360913-Chlamydomonas_euryale.AAC.4